MSFVSLFLWSLIIILPLAQANNGRIIFEGQRTYPSIVSLSNSLPSSPQEQSYGECHVMAAASVAEAACYRRTGKIFNLSTAYLFYRHIRTELGDWNNEYFLSFKGDGMLTQNDGGWPLVTIQRIQNGSVMLNSEYTIKDFDRGLAVPLATRKAYWREVSAKKNPDVRQWEIKIREDFSRELDKAILARNEAQLSKADFGYNYIVTNKPSHPLKACEFPKLKYHNFSMTPERAVALITAGYPILCTAKLKGIGGHHAVVYAGYQYRPELPEKLGFFVRDSRLKKQLDSGWAPYCKGASVVYNDYEEAEVLRLVQL